MSIGEEEEQTAGHEFMCRLYVAGRAGEGGGCRCGSAVMWKAHLSPSARIALLSSVATIIPRQASGPLVP